MGIKWEERTIAEKICTVLGGCLLCAAFICLLIEFSMGRYPLCSWFFLSCANILLGIVTLRSSRALGIVMIVIHGITAIMFGWNLLIQIL